MHRLHIINWHHNLESEKNLRCSAGFHVMKKKKAFKRSLNMILVLFKKKEFSQFLIPFRGK